MKRLSRQLLQKSQEAFILSIEIFNKPTISYRLEGFCFFYINAWELLLKAKIIESTKKDESIYYDRKDKTRSISLTDCLRKVFTNEKDAIRKNIEEIDKLRNAATHLIIQELESVYVGLFQAGVINYSSKLKEWFNRSITDIVSPAMLSLVYDIKTFDPVVIERRYGKDILDFALKTRNDIATETSSYGNDYSIPVEYRLVLTKSNSKDSDIELTHSDSGNVQAVILEVPKDLERTHPYRTAQAVEAIKNKLGDKINFTRHDFLCVLQKEKIKEKAQPKYYHKINNPETHYYSESLIDFVVDRVLKDTSYLRDARQSYSVRNLKKSMSKK